MVHCVYQACVCVLGQPLPDLHSILADGSMFIEPFTEVPYIPRRSVILSKVSSHGSAATAKFSQCLKAHLVVTEFLLPRRV